jgi:hypothetical protein
MAKEPIPAVEDLIEVAWQLIFTAEEEWGHLDSEWKHTAAEWRKNYHAYLNDRAVRNNYRLLGVLKRKEGTSNE